MQTTRRREFLGGLTLAGAAMAWPSLLRAAGAPWKPRLALSSVMFSHLSLGDFCAVAQKLGFVAIDHWGPFDKCVHMREAVAMGPEKFQALLKQHGLQVGAWTHYAGKDRGRGFPEFIDFLSACGGGIVVRGTEYGNVAKDKLEGAIEAFYEKLAPEIELARKHKIRIALENHSWSIFDSARSFELFDKHNPAPEVVGYAIAPYHLQRRKEDVVEIIRSYGRKTLFFYAWQLAEGTGQLPGHGPVDLRPWMQALAEVGYDHWMTPFMHGELPVEDMSAAVAKSAAYLNQLKLES